jgi:hypothetical protein
MDQQRSWGQRLWWLQPDPAIVWSPEERWTRGTIWLIAGALWVFPFWGVYAITNDLGVDRHISAAIALFTTMPPALWFARMIAVRVWPETVRQADENAAKRLMTRKSKRL